ncbi:MAG: hypothetical protein J7M08_06155 [Planctomycetes bacterium]|nr:hypothetical protein [Planctomycetota bacterium]
MSKKRNIANEDQTRVLGATLGLLDEMLCRIEGWARGHEVRSVLYEAPNPDISRAFSGFVCNSLQGK